MVHIVTGGLKYNNNIIYVLKDVCSSEADQRRSKVSSQSKSRVSELWSLCQIAAVCFGGRPGRKETLLCREERER